MRRENPDDSPDPIRVTPSRLAADLHSIGEQLSKLSLRVRTLAPYLDRGPIEVLHDAIRTAACRAVDLGSSVRVGQTPIVDCLDVAAGRGERPLIDRIESAEVSPQRTQRPQRVESTDAESETIAAKSETIERSPDLEPYRNGLVELEPVVLPPANGAKPTSRRRRRERKPATFSWEVWAIDPNEATVALDPISVPTRDDGEALEFAQRAYTGAQYRDVDGLERPIDPARLKVFRTGSPAAVKAAAAEPVIERDFEKMLEAESEADVEPPTSRHEDLAQVDEWFRIPGIRTGGEYEADELALDETFDELRDRSSADMANSAKRGAIGKLRGVVWVPGVKAEGAPAPYAVTGGFYPGCDDPRPDVIDLTPLAEESRWMGPIFDFSHLNPVSGYYGIKATYRGTRYVLGHMEQRIKAQFPRPATERARSANRLAVPADDAEAKRQRKREADRRYNEKRRAAKAEVSSQVVEETRSAAEVADWQNYPLANLDLSENDTATATRLGLKTAGDVAAYLATKPKVPFPFGSFVPWPKILEGFRHAVDLVRPVEPAAEPTTPPPAVSVDDPTPAVVPSLFVFWQGRNPVYAISARSIEEAREHVYEHHPIGFDELMKSVKPDDGTAAERRLPLFKASADLSSAAPVPGTKEWDDNRDMCTLHGGAALPEGHDRVFLVLDRRSKPATVIDEIAAENVTRAQLAAEAKWPDVPRKMLELKPKLFPGGKRQVTRPVPPPAKPERDAEWNEFNAQFEPEAAEARAAVERRKPRPSRAEKVESRK